MTLIIAYWTPDNWNHIHFVRVPEAYQFCENVPHPVKAGLVRGFARS